MCPLLYTNTTSHVNVQFILLILQFKKFIYLNTSHVNVQYGGLSECCEAMVFKYISC